MLFTLKKHRRWTNESSGSSRWEKVSRKPTPTLRRKPETAKMNYNTWVRYQQSSQVSSDRWTAISVWDRFSNFLATYWTCHTLNDERIVLCSPNQRRVNPITIMRTAWREKPRNVGEHCHALEIRPKSRTSKLLTETLYEQRCFALLPVPDDKYLARSFVSCRLSSRPIEIFDRT